MKRILILIFLPLLGLVSFDPPPPPSPNMPPVPGKTDTDDSIPFSDKRILPDRYTVYTDGVSKVINRPLQGYKKVTLTNDNSFKGVPGCYIACYSRIRKGSTYPVGGGIFVMGQIRVPGGYVGGICRPTENEWDDISAMQKYKTLCGERLRNCPDNDSCWAGGDTNWGL
jgi:hypothetical protein